MRSVSLLLALAGGACLLAACSPSKNAPAADAASSAGAVAALSEARAAHSRPSYASPFAYCRAVGTIDQPDSRYTGPNPPPAVIAGLIEAFGAPPSATRSQAFTHGTSWRCMDGAVYACNVGANLPCESKANTDRTPTDGERKYCTANHDAAIIPMYVTGHNTVYDWSCKGNRPTAGKQIAAVGKRGYLAKIWYRIAPPGSAPSPATVPATAPATSAAAHLRIGDDGVASGRPASSSHGGIGRSRSRSTMQ